MTINQWKEKVSKAILKKNGEKLLMNCTSESSNDFIVTGYVESVGINDC